MDKLKFIKDFILKWSDLTIFIPCTLIAFVFSSVWIRFLDPSASIVHVEYLGILTFNLLKLGVITSVTYFIYNLFFGDYFKRQWEKRHVSNPVLVVVVNLILFFGLLGFSAYVLLQNLTL